MIEKYNIDNKRQKIKLLVLVTLIAILLGKIDNSYCLSPKEEPVKKSDSRQIESNNDKKEAILAKDKDNQNKNQEEPVKKSDSQQIEPNDNKQEEIQVKEEEPIKKSHSQQIESSNDKQEEIQAKDNDNQNKNQEEPVKKSDSQQIKTNNNKQEEIQEKDKDTQNKNKNQKKNKKEKNSHISAFGITLKKTTKSEIASKFSIIQTRSKSKIPEYEVIGLDTKNFSLGDIHISEVLVVINPQKKVEQIILIISGQRFHKLNQILSKKYRIKFKEEPFVGNCIAEYETKDDIICLEQPFMGGFNTHLIYSTKEYRNLLETYVQKEKEKNQQEIENQL